MAKRGPHRPREQASQERRSVRNFLKKWRIFRNHTVEQLAERAEMSPANVSAIENLRQGFSPESLEKLAHALKIDSGMLLHIDPTADEAMWTMWTAATPDQREQITSIVGAIVKPKR